VRLAKLQKCGMHLTGKTCPSIEFINPHAQCDVPDSNPCDGGRATAAARIYGFARAYCDKCQHDFLIAYSCKCRGVCLSCNTRRMAETAAHLVDHVFPPLPVRQWVLGV
jgi:hypothetical protein